MPSIFLSALVLALYTGACLWCYKQSHKSAQHMNLIPPCLYFFRAAFVISPNVISETSRGQAQWSERANTARSGETTDFCKLAWSLLIQLNLCVLGCAAARFGSHLMWQQSNRQGLSLTAHLCSPTSQAGAVAQAGLAHFGWQA